MRVRQASALGAMGLALAVGLHWARGRPGGCRGVVTVELEPPLLGPAPYRLELVLDDAAPCVVTFRLDDELTPGAERCPLVRRMMVGGDAAHPGVEGFTVAALPERLSLRIWRGDELVHDSASEPANQGKDAPDAEAQTDARLCGRSVLVRPPCLRGSSQCEPFAVSCRRPADCEGEARCCATPDWARRYGSRYAMQCTSRAECESRIESYLVCVDDTDCPGGMRCGRLAALSAYAEPLLGCTPVAQPPDASP